MQAATAAAPSVLHLAGRHPGAQQNATQVVTAGRHADCHPHALLHRRRQEQALRRVRRPATAPHRRARRVSATAPCTGSLNGNLVSDIAYENKGKTGQYTGCYLKNFADGLAVVLLHRRPVWNTEAPVRRGGLHRRRPTLGDIKWGGWESEPGENPNDCLRTTPSTACRSSPTWSTTPSRASSSTPPSTSAPSPSARPSHGAITRPHRRGLAVRHQRRQHQAADDHGTRRLIRPHHSSPRPTRVGGCFMHCQPDVVSLAGTRRPVSLRVASEPRELVMVGGSERRAPRCSSQVLRGGGHGAAEGWSNSMFSLEVRGGSTRTKWLVGPGARTRFRTWLPMMNDKHARTRPTPSQIKLCPDLLIANGIRPCGTPIRENPEQ